MSDDRAVSRADRLREAADAAAHVVGTLYATFLLLGAYIGITIGATTDEQLLRVSPVTLPLLNVGLPIVGFYALVPWLLVLVHFNLLLQLYLLARKLHAFDAALAGLDEEDRAEQRARLVNRHGIGTLDRLAIGTPLRVRWGARA